MTVMTAVVEDRFYEWTRTESGDYRLRIWEDGVLIQDELFDPIDFQ